MKKPIPEDFIQDLNGDKLQSDTMEFADYLNKAKMKPIWYSGKHFRSNYKKQIVLRLHLEYPNTYPKGSLGIAFKLLSIDENILNQVLSEQTDEIKNMVMKKIRICTECGNCAPGRKYKLLDNMTQNICWNEISYVNPTSDEFEEIKILIQLRRKCIDISNLQNQK